MMIIEMESFMNIKEISNTIRQERRNDDLGLKDRINSEYEALRQVKAAKGIPVIWRVGSDQVKAFRKALKSYP